MTQQLEKVVEQSFLDYSAFVIQRRSIPDARDMLKYTARQILHAQYKDKLDAKHPFKKSQKSVAAATSFSYVHGEASCYEQIIRMGRPLVQRYFLEEINGNGGTPMNSGDYSAQRYTEARLTTLSSQLFDMLAMDTLDSGDWEPTYDEEGVFPKVLPSVGYYNICNGSFGSIAPTMISSIPQFNLREVNEAIICLIRDSDFNPVLYPDFASGGVLLNPKTTAMSLSVGEGKSALIRGRIRINLKEKFIEIIELPYGVYTNTICQELEKAIEKGECPATNFKDLSKRSVNLRIYGKDLEKLETWLYKNTSLQKHFTIKMIMLDKGKTPKMFTLKEALLAHIDHAKLIWRRAGEFQLNQLVERQNIIEGLLKAYSILDDIIATIKSSKGRVDAINLLVSTYTFNQKQAEAIVDLKLHKLSSIDIKELEEELEKNSEQQADLNDLLNNKERFDNSLIVQYEETAKKYGDNRRTEICQVDSWETAQDGAKPDQDFWLTKCENSYIATYNTEAETSGNVFDMRIRPDDEMIILTNEMRGFIRKGSEFLMGENKWENLIKLNKDEQVLFVMEKVVLSQFAFVEFQDNNGDYWSLHNSFILTGASKRGKKLTVKKYNITQFQLAAETSPHPKMR